jgi:hypothetical protein
MKLRQRRACVRGLIYTLVLTTTMVCSLKQDAWAMLVPAATAADASGAARPDGAPSATRAADMKIIQGTLESKILRQRLKELGLNDSEVNSRLSKLSDKQVHQLATRIHTLNPGGDFTLIGILILVVLVLFIIYLVKRV